MEFNILQYLPQKAKIKIKNRLRKDLFSNNSVTEWSKTLKVSLKNMSRYITGKRSIPLELLIKIINITKIDINELHGKIEIKIGKSGDFFKIGPFINIDSRWVYISQLINGDGHITSNLWYIIFVNNNQLLIHHVYNFFKLLGLNKKHLHILKRSDATFLIIRSALLSVIFNKILEVNIGKKEEIHIPDFIMENKEFQIAATRGSFDAEGCVSFSGTRRISIASNSRVWINQIKTMLDNLKIKSRIFKEEKNRAKPLYRILITHIVNIKRFYEIIKPLHSKRNKKLKEIIESFDKNYKGRFHKEVLSAISKGICRKKDIANYINQNLSTINNNLCWLKKHNLIFPKKKFITNKGVFFLYNLTEEGKKFLIRESSSFFD